MKLSFPYFRSLIYLSFILLNLFGLDFLLCVLGQAGAGGVAMGRRRTARGRGGR